MAPGARPTRLAGPRQTGSPPSHLVIHVQPYCHTCIIATILRLQALTLTTAARYRRASHSVKIVAPTLFFRVPFLFTATMSSSADLSASLQVKKLSPTATLPTRGSSLSAGFDLSANEKKVCNIHHLFMKLVFFANSSHFNHFFIAR